VGKRIVEKNLGLVRISGSQPSHKMSQTRNAWQSLAYSPHGAVVSPASEYL